MAQLDTCAPVESVSRDMHYVYVIRSLKDGRFYVGMTTNVENRVSEHNSRKTKCTKAYIPWQLIFVEKFLTRIEARTREKYLKGGSGKEYIKRFWSGGSIGYLPAGRQGASGDNDCNTELKG